MTALNGRHALVTGGGRGIGRAVASALSAAGASVTVTGRQEGPLKEMVAAGEASDFFVADVTAAGALANGIAGAVRSRGPVDILIANAGTAETAPFAKAEPEQFRRMFDLHVLGVVHATQAVLGQMIERGFGRIVVMASTAGLKGYPYVSAYCAAKHAAVGLVRSLAIETAKTGVTVNAICPGYTDTDLVRESAERIAAKTGRSREDAISEFAKAPIGRLIRPQEVAAAALFLCSPEAAATTGTTLTVAGGEI